MKFTKSVKKKIKQTKGVIKRKKTRAQGHHMHEVHEVNEVHRVHEVRKKRRS